LGTLGTVIRAHLADAELAMGWRLRSMLATPGVHLQWWDEHLWSEKCNFGGVFLKSKGDSAALAAWYRKHLGMQLEDFGGAILKWPDDKAEDRGLTVWHLAEKDSEWFSPSKSSFMINYRVDNLDDLLEQLRAGGVEVIQGPESHENGKFAWIASSLTSFCATC
jgi:predicted enzyme related to lactoylglutathione lyase